MVISGVILAGGAGRRMAGKDKGLLLWREKALIDHIIEQFAPQVSELVINANRNHSRYQQRGFSVVQDKLTERLGPLAGIEAGLQATLSPWLAVTPCDSPLFPNDLVKRLYQFVQEKQLPVAWVRQKDRDHPLFCLIHRALQAPLQDFLYLQGQRKVLDFFNAHGMALSFSEELPYFANFNDSTSLK